MPNHSECEIREVYFATLTIFKKNKYTIMILSRTQKTKLTKNGKVGIHYERKEII